MKIVIEIPKEFENDYKKDKLEDFFARLENVVEVRDYFWNYDMEILRMLKEAIRESEKLKNGK